MPHVIYLHSALMQNRIVPQNDEEARRLYRYTRLDVLIAMSIAGLINLSMLVVAATVFFGSGLTDIASLEGAHRTLEPILGGASSVLFALALTASGLSSATVGTLSGQVVMQGFIRRRIPLLLRRLVTMIPAFIVIGLGLDPSRTLVISQVVLSFGIPFALIPLVVFTSKREIMGVLVNRKLTIAAAVCGRRSHHRIERVPAGSDLRSGRLIQKQPAAPGRRPASSGDDQFVRGTTLSSTPAAYELQVVNARDPDPDTARGSRADRRDSR